MKTLDDELPLVSTHRVDKRERRESAKILVREQSDLGATQNDHRCRASLLHDACETDGTRELVCEGNTDAHERGVRGTREQRLNGRGA